MAGDERSMTAVALYGAERGAGPHAQLFEISGRIEYCFKKDISCYNCQCNAIPYNTYLV